MANLLVRKGKDGGQLAAPSTFEWDPLRLMRDFMRWDPFREMVPLPFEERMVEFVPAFEVKESKDGFVFKADVPGVKELDIEVTLADNRLTVSGKREAEQQEKTDTYFTYERSYGSFTRSFTLPEGVDDQHVKAELKDGVLTLVVPKKPGSEPRKIPVATTAKRS